ncbi:TNF receptor-associated factor 3-like [Oculina patagonica]
MAEGGNVPELGGYDYEFTSLVPDYWECLVCQLTMKDPVQIVGCGHRLCNICMESLLRRPSPTCPADRQPLSREKVFLNTLI